LGNLTRDPQLRYLPNNNPVCDFGLAVNRRWRDRDGNQHDEVCFVDVAAFGRQAEVINQYMSKGRPLLVEGRLKFDSWTGQDGQKRSKLSVVVENSQFVGPREGAAPGGGYSRDTDSYEPAGGHEQAGPDARPPEAPAPSGPPPSGDDIPF
jgi:single-strand DNA-binding protein